MSKVLVTGGTGKLGREVVSRLLTDHHTARILSHKKTSSCLIILKNGLPGPSDLA